MQGFNKIEQQTDVCFLIADVNILCSCMRTLSLSNEKKDARRSMSIHDFPLTKAATETY